MFQGLEIAMEVLRRFVPVQKKIRMKSRSLADQGGRACDSVILCMSEGRSRVGLDRVDLFRKSLGSARELGDALRIAEVRELITHEEFRWVDEPLDQVRAILWKMTR